MVHRTSTSQIFHYENLKDLSYSNIVAHRNQFCEFSMQVTAFVIFESFVYSIWRFVVLEIICDQFDDTFDCLSFTMHITTSNTMLEKFKDQMINTVCVIRYNLYRRIHRVNDLSLNNPWCEKTCDRPDLRQT